MFARIATRTGVQLPSPPAFALRHETKSRQRADLVASLGARSKTTAWQASSMRSMLVADAKSQNVCAEEQKVALRSYDRGASRPAVVVC